MKGIKSIGKYSLLKCEMRGDVELFFIVDENSKPYDKQIKCINSLFRMLTEKDVHGLTGEVLFDFAFTSQEKAEKAMHELCSNQISKYKTEEIVENGCTVKRTTIQILKPSEKVHYFFFNIATVYGLRGDNEVKYEFDFIGDREFLTQLIKNIESK
jgi:hypothetical protein